jgi:hypothetical protein
VTLAGLSCLDDEPVFFGITQEGAPTAGSVASRPLGDAYAAPVKDGALLRGPEAVGCEAVHAELEFLLRRRNCGSLFCWV